MADSMLGCQSMEPLMRILLSKSTQGLSHDAYIDYCVLDYAWFIIQWPFMFPSLQSADIGAHPGPGMRLAKHLHERPPLAPAGPNSRYLKPKCTHARLPLTHTLHVVYKTCAQWARFNDGSAVPRFPHRRCFQIMPIHERKVRMKNLWNHQNVIYYIK